MKLSGNAVAICSESFCEHCYYTVGNCYGFAGKEDKGKLQVAVESTVNASRDI